MTAKTKRIIPAASVVTEKRNTSKSEPIKIEVVPEHHAEPPKPEKLRKVLNMIFQWLVIFGVITGIYFIGRTLSIKLPELHLMPYQIIILAFCFAFTWVYIFKWGSVKPFNCVTCMSGWFALIIGYWAVGWWAIAYMPIAMTVAALYSEIRMRWL